MGSDIMALNGKKNHYNVKVLQSYGVSITLKDLINLNTD